MAGKHDFNLVSRREALRRVGALLGGASLVGGSALLAACAAPRPSPADVGRTPFSEADLAFLDQAAEVLLPETATPGARAAGVGPFMAVMVTDCYEPRDQQVFRDGLQNLEDRSVAELGLNFMDASFDEQTALLEAFDREQKAYMDGKPADQPAHWFRMFKELALLGYFTSEVGCTQALRYVETPGRFDPCAPLAPGEPAWANHA